MTWAAPVAPGKLNGEVRLPGSKSLTNRHLVLAALAQEPTLIKGMLRSRDSDLMVAALQNLGAKCHFEDETTLTISPATWQLQKSEIDCGLAGTVMRFVPPLATLVEGTVTFDGDPQARRRPMAPLLDALTQLGVDVTYLGEQGFLPFTVQGQGALPGGQVELKAGASSQFISALLLVAPRAKAPLTVQVNGSYPSSSHVDMTVECLQSRGAQVKSLAAGTWQVIPGPISGGAVEIEPDLSNAGPFILAPLLAGGQMLIKNWPAQTTQVGDKWRELVTLLGGNAIHVEGDLLVSGSGQVSGVEVDLSDGGELVPALAAAAALASTPSAISGIGHLRGHETDRLSALVNEINKLGGNAVASEDSLYIDPAPLHGGIVSSYADHRMATFGALLGLKVPGIQVDDISCTSKTMDDFPGLWNQMLERI